MANGHHQSFQLLLVNERQRFYKGFSILLYVLNALAISLFLFYKPHTAPQLAGGIVCVLLAVSAIVLREKLSAKRFPFAGTTLVFAAIAVYWASIDIWAAVVVVLGLAMLQNVVNTPPLVEITDRCIRYPSFPKRTIEWNELNNVVLKDGLLTLDFRNNRIIQQLVDTTAYDAAHEKEINELCKTSLVIKPGASNPIS